MLSGEKMVENIVKGQAEHTDSKSEKELVQAAHRTFNEAMEAVKDRTEEECGDRQAYLVERFVVGREVASVAHPEKDYEHVEGPVEKVAENDGIVTMHVLVSRKSRIMVLHVTYATDGPEGRKSGSFSVERTVQGLTDEERLDQELFADQ